MKRRRDRIAQDIRALQPKHDPLVDAEEAMLRAGKNLRLARGAQRDQYSSEEVEIVASAHRLALRCGRIKLARFLTLWSRRTHVDVSDVPGTLHTCPKCGHWHAEPPRSRTKAEREAEEAALRAIRAKLRRKERCVKPRLGGGDRRSPTY